jgi:drug/metabolite transporter (DMT)-like permease
MILGEAIHWIQLAGATLVLAGVMLVTLRPGRERNAAAKAAVETPGS